MTNKSNDFSPATTAIIQRAACTFIGFVLILTGLALLNPTPWSPMGSYEAPSRPTFEGTTVGVTRKG